MPILHTQLHGEAQDAQGHKIQLEPKVALALRGPVLQVTLGVATVFAEQLVKENKPVPPPIAGWALIDTGASGTCIDDAAAKKLGLPVIDKIKMASASHGNHPVK